MSDHGIAGVSDLLREIKELRDALATADAARMAAIAGKADKAELDRLGADMARKSAELARAVDQISLRLNRPGGNSGGDTGAVTLRQSARELLELKHEARVTKSSPSELPYAPTEAELEEAEYAVKGLRHLFKATDIGQLPLTEHKALTSFSLGASGFILVPEMSNEILSCLVDITDVTGMVRNVAISGPSIKFMTDNIRLDTAAWACESTCFANNPTADFTNGLGEVEYKPEPLRYILCATRDLLEDASFNVEQWAFGKVADAFRRTISQAIMTGDGVGKPLGLLHPAAGIPVCDAGPGTPAGQFSWQDLVSLKFEIPLQYHANLAYYMNQRTFGQLLTMSDALGRPLMIATPVDPARWVINGSPAIVNTWLPDIAPGATPILCGDLKPTYMLVNRKQITMIQDIYSAGYCVLLKFEARVGGGIICANASRLLRIK
jgi:HK97 family phage major capsid protein